MLFPYGLPPSGVPLANVILTLSSFPVCRLHAIEELGATQDSMRSIYEKTGMVYKGLHRLLTLFTKRTRPCSRLG